MKIIAAVFEPSKMHIYDVKTSGKHPVHLISGGEYITEDTREDFESDMGWFWLNQKEYNYFKSMCEEIDIPYTQEERLQNHIQFLNGRIEYLEKENRELTEQRDEAIRTAQFVQDDYSRAFKRLQDYQAKLGEFKKDLANEIFERVQFKLMKEVDTYEDGIAYISNENANAIVWSITREYMGVEE